MLNRTLSPCIFSFQVKSDLTLVSCQPDDDEGGANADRMEVDDQQDLRNLLVSYCLRVFPEQRPACCKWRDAVDSFKFLL